MNNCGWVKNGGKCILEQENTELKDNWNKLKEWLEETIEQYGGFAKYRFESVYNKMQEIEEKNDKRNMETN